MLRQAASANSRISRVSTAGRHFPPLAIGGLPEIVADGETGILVPPGDAGLLGQAIGRLIENEALRLEMGHKGQERFRKEFSAEVVVPKIEQVYLDTRSGKVGSR